jgi:hypothetical protein
MIKPSGFYFFKRKPIVQKSRYELWMVVVNLQTLRHLKEDFSRVVQAL